MAIVRCPRVNIGQMPVSHLCNLRLGRIRANSPSHPSKPAKRDDSGRLLYKELASSSEQSCSHLKLCQAAMLDIFQNIATIFRQSWHATVGHTCRVTAFDCKSDLCRSSAAQRKAEQQAKQEAEDDANPAINTLMVRSCIH